MPSRISTAVTISLVPQAKGGPFVYWDDLNHGIERAAALGFDAIELFAPGPDTVSPSTLRQSLKDTGLKLAAVGTGAGWVVRQLRLTDPDSAIRRQAMDFVRSMIDFGGVNGAPAIIGSMQGRWGGEVSKATAMGWLGEALVDLGEHARQYNVPLIYEPLNRYETNLCQTQGEGVLLLEEFGATNTRLLADLFHMNIEEVNIAAGIRQSGRWLGHVHCVDTTRCAVGVGHMDWPPIVAALREVGYGGYVSAECLPWPNSDAAAEQTIRLYRELFGA
ncbi:MAG: sugar phosphate isomerase/epimerase [Planctomycetota bacterium]|nr:MAG: sugar phosphate isomerase/epimerase [Planctomycetota bacterium]